MAKRKEQIVFVDSVGTNFCSMFLQLANCYVMLLRVVWTVEMSRNWFRCVFVVNFDIS